MNKYVYSHYDDYLVNWAISFEEGVEMSCAKNHSTKVKGLVTGRKVRVLGVSGDKWNSSDHSFRINGIAYYRK